jgi:hypothetical protein
MPLGKTETISSMAGPKQVTSYDPSLMRILDGEINFFKKIKKDSVDLLSYQDQEHWEDQLRMAKQKKKDYLENPEFRQKMNKIMRDDKGTSWYSPQFGQQTDTPGMDEIIEGGKRGTTTYNSPYAKGGFGTFPKTDTRTKSASAKVKKATVKTPMNPYGFASGTEYDISKDLTERKMNTLRELQKDPFLYGNDGVEEALKQGYLSPEMADLYYKEGEDAARKAMGLGKNPLAWDDNLSATEHPEIPNYAKTQLADPNGLSVRTKNFLDSNVKTIEDFMALTEDKVRKSRNTSKDTWSEIQKFKEELAKDLSLVEDPKDLDMVSKEQSTWKMVMSGEYVKPKDPKAKMDQTIKQLEDFLEDLDKEIAAEAAQKNKVVELPTPKKKKSLAGVFKGLGRATVAGLAEAPALEFLSPPSAGPSDPEDPVNQYERGQMSQEDFDEFIKQAAKTRKKTNYFDPLQTMLRGLQSK